MCKQHGQRFAVVALFPAFDFARTVGGKSATEGEARAKIGLSSFLHDGLQIGRKRRPELRRTPHLRGGQGLTEGIMPSRLWESGHALPRLFTIFFA